MRPFTFGKGIAAVRTSGASSREGPLFCATTEIVAKNTNSNLVAEPLRNVHSPDHAQISVKQGDCSKPSPLEDVEAYFCTNLRYQPAARPFRSFYDSGEFVTYIIH
jgi:hypothetical protein